jgi:hypothetical protein
MRTPRYVPSSYEELDGGDCLMGANSKQGWFLFLFLIGFTFLVAGLAYLGFIFALAGLGCLIVAMVGFHQIRPLEEGSEGERRAGAAPVVSPIKARLG